MEKLDRIYETLIQHNKSTKLDSFSKTAIQLIEGYRLCAMIAQSKLESNEQLRLINEELRGV